MYYARTRDELLEKQCVPACVRAYASRGRAKAQELRRRKQTAGNNAGWAKITPDETGNGSTHRRGSCKNTIECFRRRLIFGFMVLEKSERARKAKERRVLARERDALDASQTPMAAAYSLQLQLRVVVINKYLARDGRAFRRASTTCTLRDHNACTRFSRL